jgi:hypothetical protein
MDFEAKTRNKSKEILTPHSTPALPFGFLTHFGTSLRIIG